MAPGALAAELPAALVVARRSPRGGVVLTAHTCTYLPQLIPMVHVSPCTTPGLGGMLLLDHVLSTQACCATYVPNHRHPVSTTASTRARDLSAC